MNRGEAVGQLKRLAAAYGLGGEALLAEDHVTVPLHELSHGAAARLFGIGHSLELDSRYSLPVLGDLVEKVTNKYIQFKQNLASKGCLGRMLYHVPNVSPVPDLLVKLAGPFGHLAFYGFLFRDGAKRIEDGQELIGSAEISCSAVGAMVTMANQWSGTAQDPTDILIARYLLGQIIEGFRSAEVTDPAARIYASVVTAAVPLLAFYFGMKARDYLPKFMKFYKDGVRDSIGLVKGVFKK